MGKSHKKLHGILQKHTRPYFFAKNLHVKSKDKKKSMRTPSKSIQDPFLGMQPGCTGKRGSKNVLYTILGQMTSTLNFSSDDSVTTHDNPTDFTSQLELLDNID